MGIVEAKKKEKIDSILSSAYDLFIEKGINKTSISDITRRAKIAKGTFYLYFKDKYQLREIIIINKSREIFNKAINDLEKSSVEGFHEKIIFIVDEIINYFNFYPKTLEFIEKNLSWTVFRNFILDESEGNNIRIYIEKLINESKYIFDNPELMLFTIIEIVNASCHNIILYNEPVSLDVLKKYLYRDIESIVDNHIVGEK